MGNKEVRFGRDETSTRLMAVYLAALEKEEVAYEVVEKDETQWSVEIVGH